MAADLVSGGGSLRSRASPVRWSSSSARSAAAAPVSSRSFDAISSRLQAISQQNNLWSAAQAQHQMDFQSAQNRLAMQFNREEAQRNRDWQRYMSDTAHQREIRDLQAAGLNPVLSAMGGNGAPVTSGATASGYTASGAKGDTDTSLVSGIVGLLGTLIQSQTALANTATSANTNLAVADKYNAMSKYVSELQSQTQLTSANISAMASRYASDNAASATKVSASIHAAAQRYGYDVGAMTQRDIAQFNATVNKDLAQMGYKHDFDIRTAFPTTELGALSSIFGQFTGSDGLSGVKGAFDSAKNAIRNAFTRFPSGGGNFSGGFGGARGGRR